MKTIYDTEELDQIRDLARRFAQDRVEPGYLEREGAGRFNHALVAKMGALGLIAPELPETLGGMGASYLASGVIIVDDRQSRFHKYSTLRGG